MEFETLADLVDAYESGMINDDCPLLFDEENNILYIEKNGDDEEVLHEDESDGDDNDRHRFRLNIRQFILEAANILGIPIDA